MIQRVGEVALELNAVAILEFAEVDAPLAHQVEDDLAAQYVILTQVVTPVNRQHAAIQPRIVLGQFLDTLAVAVADLADRGHADADQVAVGVGRVPLEVALQGAVLAGLRQLIVRQGEVVHTDVDVTGGGQPLDGQLQQFQLALRRRHVLRANQPLRPHQIRQVRVAVGSDAVRAHVDDLAQGDIEALDGLQRQAVDQVDTDRLELRFAGGLDQLASLLLALQPVDRGLHRLVEVLHAEAQAIEAQCAQLMDLHGRNGTRIDFQGEFVIITVVQVEGRAQRVHQVFELLAGQVGRRAAAQVQLGQLAGFVEQRRLHGDLALEVFQVLYRPLGLVGDDLVAGAVIAQALAERDVDIHRQALGFGGGVAGFGSGLIVIHGERLMKLRRGRVRGITRARPVVFLDQGPVEADFLRHYGVSPSSRICVKCTASSGALHGARRGLRLRAAAPARKNGSCF